MPSGDDEDEVRNAMLCVIPPALRRPGDEGGSVLPLLPSVFVSSRCLRDGLYERAVSTAPQCHAAAPWSVGRFVNICVRTSLRSCAAMGEKSLTDSVGDGDAPVTCAPPLPGISEGSLSAHGCLPDGTGRLREFPPGPAQGH